jgi:hypothetical protein
MPTTAPFSSNETVFAVVNLSTTGGAIIGSSRSSRGRFMTAFAVSAAPSAIRLFSDTTQHIGGKAGGPVLNTTDKYLIAYINSVPENYYEHSWNGIQDGFNSNDFTYTAGSFTNIIGGTTATGTVSSYDSYIYEMIVFNTNLTTDQRISVYQYLVNKWNIPVGPNFPVFPFYRSPPLLRQFNPLDIENCVIWLDASDTSTLTLSGTNVTQWNDKSGNSNTAVAGNNPVYAANTLNRLGTIQLRGSNDYFLVSNNLTTTTYPSLCYFVVLNVSSSQPSGVLRGGILSTDSAGAYGRSLGITGGSYEEEYYSNFVTLTSYSAGSWAIAVLQFSRTSATTFTLNGVSYTGTPSGTGTNTTGFKIGSYNSNTGYADFNANFDVAEILVYGNVIREYERQQIEGYLAQKWGLINNLPSTHLYKTNFAAVPIFDPRLVSFCALWLDANDATTLSLSGSNVTQWRDKSGNGFHATAYQSPTLTTMNGLTGIAFGGNNNFDGSIATRASAVTVFAIASNPGTASGYLRLVSLATLETTTDSTTDGFVVALEQPDDATAIGGERNTGTAYSSGAGTITANTVFMACSTWSTNTVNIFVNGTLRNNSSYSKGAFTYLNYAIGRAIQLGFGGTNPTFVWPGSVGEVLVFNVVLSTYQRQQVEGYLAWKWKLQSSLPSTHPYSKYPPY